MGMTHFPEALFSSHTWSFLGKYTRTEKDITQLLQLLRINWYRLAKDNTGVERYVRSVQGQESVRLLFRLRTGSARLLEDKKRFRMVSDERRVICDSGVGEDVAHFLVSCGEFEGDRLVLLDDQNCGAREDEFWRVDEKGKVALLLEKEVEGIYNRVMEDVQECILYWVGRWL